MRFSITLLLLVVSFETVAQNSYAPAVGLPGSKAIYKDSSIIKSWASACKVQRGYIDIANKTSGKVDYGKADYAIGKSDPGVVSLGDSGIATLSFDGVVHNGPGPDFCVFENSFSDNYLELAFVEVSSDGINYFRFPAFSETDTATQVGPWGFLEASNLYNLAGKYRGQYGTPFDLQEMVNIAGLNVDSVKHIRMIDVIGSIDTNYASFDSKGRRINDPYPTDMPTNNLYSGGFDLDAVGLINYTGKVFLSNHYVQPRSAELSVFPNPAIDILNISKVSINSVITVYNIAGERFEVNSIGDLQYDVSNLNLGLYLIEVNDGRVVYRGRFAKL
ncbi:MAG: secretion protein [Crocinitomicaceae bacterium]|nr:secretion protein [Crocinitomicaceae bacterium]|tara:strand:+ start:16011 stop:17006 length:996 start_codon:yes stop_codon:yes gene_type:complete